MPGLNEKQRRFVSEYLIDFNATQAAIRAGYSAKTAEQQGPRLLGNAQVSEALREAIQAQQARTLITADRVLLELGRIGFSDLRRVFDAAGRLMRPEQWSDETAAAVASVEVVTRNLDDGEVEHIHKIKLWDKPRALEQIGRHLGMFTDKLELSGNVGLADRLQAARSRAKGATE